MNLLFVVIEKIKKDHLTSLANELTYKLVLSIFPFLIFLMTLLGFTDINIDNILSKFIGTVPNDIIDIVKNFYKEVVSQRHLSLLSGSLIQALNMKWNGVNF